MTATVNESGMWLFNVTDIKTTRILSDGRSRLRDADKKAVADIKESFQQYGQLVPLVIEEDGELVDGLHRLTAAIELGWKQIGVTTREKMDDFTARTLELETNLKRKDLSWQQKEYALTELHKLHAAKDPTWSQDVTGSMTGKPQPRVAESLLLTKMIELFPEIGEAKSRNQALSWARQKAAAVVRVTEVKNAPEVYAGVEERIILGDSRVVIKSIPDASINFVLTDPPFGINYDDRKAGTESTLSTYQDDEDNYLSLLSMAPEIFRVIKHDGWLVWFLGPTWYERAKLAFREAGFTVDEIPIIWDRSDGRVFTTRPDRYFGRGYDMALHCIKGNPEVIQRNKPNVIRVPPVSVDERTLTVERPVELYAELIRRLTVKGEMVVDFFTGSGSVLAAAASLERQFMGVELDPERRAVAIKKVKAHLPQPK